MGSPLALTSSGVKLQAKVYVGIYHDCTLQGVYTHVHSQGAPLHFVFASMPRLKYKLRHIPSALYHVSIYGVLLFDAQC